MTRKKQNRVGISPKDFIVNREWIIADHELRLSVRTVPPVRQEGSTEKALFLIHGVAGSSDVWVSQIEYFSQRGYHIVAPDLIGHGFSSAPNDPELYTFHSICKHCLLIFDKLRKDVNIVVGHSYGTSFAAYLSRARAQQVHKLVLMSGGAPVSLSPHTGILSLPYPLLSCMRPALTKLFNRNAFHKKSKQLRNKEKAFDVPLYVLRHTMYGQEWEDGDESFHRHIHQHTLLIHGEDDKLESLGGTTCMLNVLPNCTFHVILEAGHMVMMEQPAAINEIMNKFLTKDTSHLTSKDPNTILTGISPAHSYSPVYSPAGAGEATPVASPRTKRRNSAHSTDGAMTKSIPNLKRLLS